MHGFLFSARLYLKSIDSWLRFWCYSIEKSIWGFVCSSHFHNSLFVCVCIIQYVDWQSHRIKPNMWINKRIKHIFMSEKQNQWESNNINDVNKNIRREHTQFVCDMIWYSQKFCGKGYYILVENGITRSFVGWSFVCVCVDMSMPPF